MITHQTNGNSGHGSIFGGSPGTQTVLELLPLNLELEGSMMRRTIAENQLGFFFIPKMFPSLFSADVTEMLQ